MAHDRDARFVPPIGRNVSVDGSTRPGFALEFVDEGRTTTFECIADKGGLITAWKLDGRNVLLATADSDSLDGSTFWPSPQSDWDWPPPHAIDAAPYASTVMQGSSLNFQFWFRDNAAMMAGFNLTDGINVLFQ